MSEPSKITSLARPAVQRMHAYKPGEQPQGPGWIKLNTNENPYPPSPKVREAVLAELDEDASSLRLYPAPDSGALRCALAVAHGLEASQVIVGNGSDDILNLLIRVFAESGSSIAALDPSYSLYPVLGDIQGVHCEGLELDPLEPRIDLKAVAACKSPIFFLTSPNAPTGIGFSREEVEAVCKAARGIVVVDEAYAAFAREDAASLLEHYPRLVVVRTFSKSHSLAGMRVGYALADAEMIDLLDRVRDSYNLDRLAQVAGLAALEDAAYNRQVVKKIVSSRERLQTFLDSLGWYVCPSQANFLFARPTNAEGEYGGEVAAALADFLRQERILVRYFASSPLTCPFLRITIGLEDEMEALRGAITSWMKHA